MILKHRLEHVQNSDDFLLETQQQLAHLQRHIYTNCLYTVDGSFSEKSLKVWLQLLNQRTRLFGQVPERLNLRAPPMQRDLTKGRMHVNMGNKKFWTTKWKSLGDKDPNNTLER